MRTTLTIDSQVLAEFKRRSAETHLTLSRLIEDALREHQRLFQRGHAAGLRQRREAALHALEFFRLFDPRLVGPVLDGTADAHSAASSASISTPAASSSSSRSKPDSPKRSASRSMAAGSSSNMRHCSTCSRAIASSSPRSMALRRTNSATSRRWLAPVQSGSVIAGAGAFM